MPSVSPPFAIVQAFLEKIQELKNKFNWITCVNNEGCGNVLFIAKMQKNKHTPVFLHIYAQCLNFAQIVLSILCQNQVQQVVVHISQHCLETV